MKPLKIIPAAAAPRPGAARHWPLRRCVAGQTFRSQPARASRKTICENHLPGEYCLTVIDWLKQPQLAKGDQILAVFTVVRTLPKLARILSNPPGARVGLDLRAEG